MGDEVLYGGCGCYDIDGNFIADASCIDGRLTIETIPDDGALDVCLPSVEDIRVFYFVFDDDVITNEEKSYFGTIKLR